MARQSSDKLLFEVQLVPPSASNIQTVSQAINKVSNAKQKNTKATQQSIKADKQQKSLYDKLKTDIRELETATKQAENANRFGNQTKEKSIKVTQAQLVQLEKLQKEIKQANLSRKQQAKLMNLVETKRKTMNRSMGRVREGWRGLAKANRHGNRMLMQSGRILQDLPFGFMGISNNIQELVMSWGRASNQGKSFTQVLSSMGSSLMGTGGLIFLLGSALPFAMTVATNGFMGFRNMMGKSSDDVKELKGDLGKLVDELSSIQGFEGEDILQIASLQNQLGAVEDAMAPVENLNQRIRDVVKDRRKEQEKINNELDKTIGGHRQALLLSEREHKESANQLSVLRDNREQTKERFNLTEEELTLLEEQSEELDKQITKRKAMLKISPFLQTRQFFSETVDKGIAKLRAGVDLTTDELEQLQSHMQDRIGSLMTQISKGEAGQKAVRQINFLRNEIREVDKAIEEATISFDEDDNIFDQIASDQENLSEGFGELSDAQKEFLELMTKERAESFLIDSSTRKLLKKQAKFKEQLTRKTFKLREEMAGDLVALTISTRREIAEIQKRARELGLENSKEVQRAITAFRRREVKKRTELELKRERQLRDAKFGVWSQTQSFIEAVNSNILGNSKMVALISLAVEKGLQIAKVASKTSEKVADLQQMAGVAGAKASMETAKATSAIASGNLVKAGLHSTASGKFRQAQASATAQAGKTASIGAKTIALIAGQTLAQSAGILTGGGSGGSGSGSGGGGASGGVTKADEGFNEFDIEEDFGEAGEMRDGRITGSLMEALKKTVSRDIIIRMEGELDPRLLSIKTETGRRTRESNAVTVVSDY